jgi:hypothetical protein
MIKEKEHTKVGIASIIFGILGLILYFIGLFFFSFVDNRLYGIISGIILSILAIIIGYFAKKQGDSYGIYGMILGGLVIVITVIVVILTTPTSVEFGYYS